jgi:hypothetical protein
VCTESHKDHSEGVKEDMGDMGMYWDVLGRHERGQGHHGQQGEGLGHGGGSLGLLWNDWGISEGSRIITGGPGGVHECQGGGPGPCWSTRWGTWTPGSGHRWGKWMPGNGLGPGMSICQLLVFN